MRVNEFFALKAVQGNQNDFFRKKFGQCGPGSFAKPGVYMWGFYLGDNPNCIPQKADEIVLYYIGKHQTNVINRMTEEITQFIVGGFGTIVSHQWLMNNPFSSNLYSKQQSVQCGQLGNDVIYKNYGLHVLHDFYYNRTIRKTVDWMFERLIFTWIDVDEDNVNFGEDLKNLEKELHSIAGRNTFGLGPQPTSNFCDTNNKFTTPIFHKINWDNNTVLKSWFEEVNRRLNVSHSK